MKVVRARDHKRTPWKNGGGSTVEICRDEGDGPDGFGWRLSIADIAEAGPFSAFVGYERVITVLEGQGMVLTVDGLDTAPLQAFQPFAFSGASHVNCALVDGPIRDFNLIYSPARYQAVLKWVSATCLVDATPATQVVFAATDSVEVAIAGGAWQLGRYDALVLPAHTGAQVTGHCCHITLTPR